MKLKHKAGMPEYSRGTQKADWIGKIVVNTLQRL